jgi:hypothetical protein
MLAGLGKVNGWNATVGLTLGVGPRVVANVTMDGVGEGCGAAVGVGCGLGAGLRAPG